jgi:hypothetical protein
MGKKKGKIPKKENEVKKNSPLPIHEQEKPFGFGGLPQRDLKKNLGC